MKRGKRRRARLRHRRYNGRMKNVSWVWNDYTRKWRKAGNIKARDDRNGFVDITWGVRNQAAMLTTEDALQLSDQINEALAKIWSREMLKLSRHMLQVIGLCDPRVY